MQCDCTYDAGKEFLSLLSLVIATLMHCNNLSTVNGPFLHSNKKWCRVNFRVDKIHCTGLQKYSLGEVDLPVRGIPFHSHLHVEHRPRQVVCSLSLKRLAQDKQNF